MESFARLGLCVLVLALSGCGVTEVLDRAPDGRAILIRSPQPDADDLQDLKQDAGLAAVLNLRGESPDRGWFQEEARGVEAARVRWYHLPVSGSQPPKPAELETFFALVEDPANWPLLIHCQGGVHRTGAFSAIYRMQYQGWKPERAVAEMEDNYFNWTTRDRSALKEWLLRYVRDPARRLPHQATPPPPASPGTSGS